MATTSDFITTFSAQVYTALQATGSKLLNKVTLFDGYDGVTGATVQFPKLQKSAAPVVNKSRGADLSFGSGVVHDADVSATLSSVYATELIDDLDKLQTNVNLQAAYAEALANTVGRGIDKLITDEIIANGTAKTPGGISGTKYTIADLYKFANDAVMPMDRRKLVMNSAGWQQLFTNAPQLNMFYRWEHNTATGEVDNVMAWNAIPLFDPQSYTPASTTQLCFAYHQSAVALALGGTGIVVTIDEIAQKDAMIVTAKALVAPKVLDANAVFNVTLVTP